MTASEKKLATFRQVVDLWNQGKIEEVLRWVDEECELVSRLSALGEGAYRGHEGVRRWSSHFKSAFPDWQSEIIELRMVGEATLARLRVGGHGGESRVPVEETVWQVIEWRGDKITHMGTFTSEAAALEAARATG